MDTRYVFPLGNLANQCNYYWFQEGFTPEELIQIEKQQLYLSNLELQKQVVKMKVKI